MMMIIERDGLSGCKPCDGAIKTSYLRIDSRTTDCPTKIPMYRGNPEGAKKWWYNEGTNHRVVNGQITRDIADYTWMMDIKDLEELVTLIDLYGGTSTIKKSDSTNGEMVLVLGE
jgi:hypothetical protein